MVSTVIYSDGDHPSFPHSQLFRYTTVNIDLRIVSYVSVYARKDSRLMKLAILCFRTLFEWWDGHLPAGTAGSEEAVVEIGRRLAARGWIVTIYNNCGLSPKCF